MDISALSEAAFLCDGHLTRKGDANFVPFEIVAQGAFSASGLNSFKQFPAVRYCGKYRIVRLERTATALVDERDELVGYYLGEGLAIREDGRGLLLSVPLILDAIPDRPVPTHRSVSELGERALRCAWRVVHGQAKCDWW